MNTLVIIPFYLCISLITTLSVTSRIGLLVGFVLSSILMSVVSSAVNTVIVCFAEAPSEFQRNHPELSNEMRAAWRESWPEECGF